jgi:nitrite reductase (NADH) large subunit
VLGNEPYEPYNRVKLSSLLAGDVQWDDLISDLPNPQQHPNFQYQLATVSSVDTTARTITDNQGSVHQYDKLIIATGSRPHIPNIPGTELDGVYQFRSLGDTEKLYSRVSRSRHTVVVGGGLLGLEAARALLRANTAVTVIQQAPRLMNRQLDEAAAKRLQSKVESLGIQVLTSSGVRVIQGEQRVEGVVLYNGETLACDTVLLCAGIKPNDRLARESGLKVRKAIVVDDNLQTSSEHVYAIGECCEHNQQTYGLVAPGFEQASVLADHLNGGTSAYLGSLSVSRLKVVGESVCSMGEVNDLVDSPNLKQLIYQTDSCYRKLVLFKNRIIGAVAIGEWSEVQRVQEAFKAKRKVYPWQQLRFKTSGDIWGGGFGDDPNAWPKAAIVCQCNSITQGELVNAIDDGQKTLEQLQACTGAGTVCGSCKPLLNELVGYSGPTEKEKAATPTLIISTLAMIIATAVFFMPESQTATSYLERGWFEGIWNDKFWKQVTGFTLLGLSALGLTMSLRKRIKSKRLGDFAYWRLLHIGLGLACVGILILHTGFHLGANFNQLLILDFLAVLVLGALTGLAVAFSHKLKPTVAKKFRKAWSWMHILVTWPLPILLMFHIISVYYF